MGQIQTSSKHYLSFEDIEELIPHLSSSSFQNQNKNKNRKFILIHTLTENEEYITIKNTLHSKTEIDVINHFLEINTNVHICIYGKNHSDESVHKKYKQLKDLGFYNIYIYLGGIFEWLLLRQLYSDEFYPIHFNHNLPYDQSISSAELNSSMDSKIMDLILKYKPSSNIKHIYKLLPHRSIQSNPTHHTRQIQQHYNDDYTTEYESDY